MPRPKARKSNAGRKSLYTPACVQNILRVIRETGSERAAYEDTAISKTLYYDWYKKRKEFRDKVDRAKLQYRRTRPKTLRHQAEEALANYLNGEVEEVTETLTLITDPNDKVIRKRKQRQVKKLPPPIKLIERVLGQNIPILEAIQVLMSEGIATPMMAATVEKHLNSMMEELRRLPEMQSATALMKANPILETKAEAVPDGETGEG